jgi:DNA modification methylase
VSALQVMEGDCIEILKGIDPGIFDSVVTDPPYALSFMGKDWDSFGDGKGFQVWCEQWAAECLRVLKPGGHLLAFGGTRTYHREACAIEDAGFEIRDSLHWIYGSGFPKSMDVSKAIDKAAGAEREVTGKSKRHVSGKPEQRTEGMCGTSTFAESIGMGAYETAPATEAAKQWEGWGTALKPAHEPIILARKPLAGKTVAANVREYGTGGINIDGCRVIGSSHGGTWGGKQVSSIGYHGTETTDYRTRAHDMGDGSVGRWPPNIILGNDAIDEMDRQSGKTRGKRIQTKRSPDSRANRSTYGTFAGQESVEIGYDDSGGASRFFPCFTYQAKAPRSERPSVEGISTHPTVKPLALMRWLVRLVTPPGGHVLDPFAGTGTTAEACELEGLDCTLIEREADYITLISERMSKFGDKGAA